MFAPGSSNKNKYIVENKDFKGISFKKRSGRLVLYSGSKEVGGSNMVVSRLSEMENEVKQASAGSRGVARDHEGYALGGYGTKSTFPDYFREEGFKTKKDFLHVLNQRKGVGFELLAKRAIKDLSHGYEYQGREVGANQNFRIRTRQDFNNKGVVFRRIHGRIVPMRVSNKRKEDVVPF